MRSCYSCSVCVFSSLDSNSTIILPVNKAPPPINIHILQSTISSCNHILWPKPVLGHILSLLESDEDIVDTNSRM